MSFAGTVRDACWLVCGMQGRREGEDSRSTPRISAQQVEEYRFYFETRKLCVFIRMFLEDKNSNSW